VPGTVYATTVVRRRGEAPLNVVLVDLDGGGRVMSRVEGIAPEEVAVGLAVTEVEGSDPLVFRPA